MPQRLPDIASVDLAVNPSPLEWVGMKGIDLPVVIEERDYRREHHARVDAEVNLPRPNARGIHMSRLYQLIDTLAAGDAVTPGWLRSLLAAMVESHTDCGSNRARVRLEFNLLVRRGALESAEIGGWRGYPVTLEAVGDGRRATLQAEVCVAYSSTCPCSASLSRQLIEREFLRDFGDRADLSTEDVAAWLREHGTLATPHGQRSEARVGVAVAEGRRSFGLLELIDRIERALVTTVQTAVKRVDEQAFAAYSGQNLMFVEDAVRRIREALERDYDRLDVKITHMESLHAHDAVASVRS